LPLLQLRPPQDLADLIEPVLARGPEGVVTLGEMREIARLWRLVG
jgi:hypothetical protein